VSREADGDARIRAILGGPEYARLFAAVRRRIEEAGDEARSVALPALDRREADALAGLMGWLRLPRAGARLRLDRIDSALRDSAVDAGLREVLEALGGPLIDRRRKRVEEEAARRALWSRAKAGLAERGLQHLTAWLEELRAHGLVARAAASSGETEAALLERAIACAARLPAQGILLAVLAAEELGDAHALDPGQPVAGLVLRAAKHLAGWSEVPTAAEARRRLWAEVGVLCDPLSAQVLVHGMRPGGAERLARELRDAADDGEPRRLTWRELTRSAFALPAGTVVSVCENPSVVAASAERLGAASGPLVCVEGQPSTAAIVLLRRLAEGGARLRFHADFDWAGVRIGNQLAALGAEPWRFREADYAAAAGCGSELLAEEGRPVEASWDGALSGRMREVGRAVFEEQVIEALLSDLA
jgi:uncharacterized protein (TIGR02679 family)